MPDVPNMIWQCRLHRQSKPRDTSRRPEIAGREVRAKPASIPHVKTSHKELPANVYNFKYICSRKNETGGGEGAYFQPVLDMPFHCDILS